MPRRPVVEHRAEGHDDVGLRDAARRRAGTRSRPRCRARTGARRRARWPSRRWPAARPCARRAPRSPRPASDEHGSPARDQHGPLGRGEHVRRGGDRVARRVRRRRQGRERRGPAVGLRGRLGRQVDRHHQHHGPALDAARGAARGRRPARPRRPSARARPPRRRTRRARAGRCGSSTARAAAGVSPARTSSGVEAFTASARPVIVFVRPGPWCTLHTPTRPVTRAQPSAMQTAPPSWRAAWKVAPSARSAFVTTKLPLPATPNTVSTPSAPSVLPTLSATCEGMPRSPGRGKVGVCYTGQPVPMQTDCPLRGAAR